MSGKLPILDTNIIIRFLTSDTKEHADRAERLFAKAAARSLYIPDLIVTEIAYMLLSFYKLSKEEVVEKVSILLDFKKFKTNKKVLRKTLEIFAEGNISFIDAYLCALVVLGKNEFIYSFDKKLGKVQGAICKAPG